MFARVQKLVWLYEVIMKRSILLVSLVLLGCGATPAKVSENANFPKVPDPRLTPGSLCTRTDPDFDELRYLERIPHCRRNVSNGTKTQVYQSYGLGSVDRSQFSVDHLVSLAFGGSNNIKNLWPQHKSIYTGKAEYWTFCRLRDGALNQVAAIRTITDIKLGLMPLSSVTQPINCDAY